MKRRPPRWDQAGFTLVEALIGGLLAMLLGLPCYALLRANLSALDIVASRSQQAEQARETFRLLGDGTASFGTQMVEGLHSRASLPSPWALRSTTALGQFVTSDGAVQLSVVSITCQSAGVPIADCTGTEKRTVQGWRGSDPVVAQSTSNGIQFPVTVTIAMTHPFRAARSVGSAFGATQSLGITETFRTQFYTMVEAAS